MEEGRKEQIESRKPAKTPGRSRFLLTWVAASSGGWIIGGLLGALLSYLVVVGGWGDPEFFFESDSLDSRAYAALFSLPLALAGFMACAMQRLALRPHFPEVDGWVRASGVAWILAGPVVAASLGLNPDSAELSPIGFYVAPFIVGAMVGATQWLVAQGQASRVWLWIAASAVGWGLGAIPLVVGYGLVIEPERIVALVGGLLLIAIGLVAGPGITGLVLARCLREPPSRPVNRRRTTLLVGVLWLLLVVAALVILFR